MSDSKLFSSPFGDFELSRWEAEGDKTLIAWDAADSLLLQHVAENVDVGTGLRVLVVNDGFGALCCAIHHLQPVSWSDSFISHQSATRSLERNVPGAELSILKSTESLSGLFDLVLIKIPKTTALLEHQLHTLRPHLHKDSKVVAGAMIKQLARSAFEAFENIIGPVSTSLAVKKARLVFSSLDEGLVVGPNPYPSTYTDPDAGFALINHASLFSRDHLDHGTRFFLEQFHRLPESTRVIDLACGNGVLGITYKRKNCASNLVFVDESYMAIESTQVNYQNIVESDCSAMSAETEFQITDGLSEHDTGSADLILCNPPFHQQQVVGRSTAVGFFSDSKRCLVRHGELWLVANRHLDYQSLLKQYFGNCSKVASNEKFVVLKVAKR